MLSDTWWDCWDVCVGTGVGLNAPDGSLPTRGIP